MFGLMSGKITLKRRFESAEAAREWGEWNARGRGEYKVVMVDDAGVALAVQDAPIQKRKRGDCNCEYLSSKQPCWTCPVHGNVAR